MLTKLVVGLLGGVLLTLAGGCSDAGHQALTLPTSKPQSTVVGADFGGSQLTTNRSNEHRAVCVGVAGGAERELIDQPALEEAIGLLEQDLVGSSLDEVVLSLGCPVAAAERLAKPYQPDGPMVVGGSVLSPSDYSVHIYYVSRETLNDWFGPDVDVGRSTEEMFCGNPPMHNCAAVTAGVYIVPGTDAGAIYQRLRFTFGLR